MKALIVVDVQNDFCEGGALAVNGGTTLGYKIAEYINIFGGYYDEIVYTKDWHKAPPDTNGGHFGDPPDFKDSWPVHCVADTIGAEFHPAIGKVANNLIFRKGFGKPDYSGFQAVHDTGLTLPEFLQVASITSVNVVGIAGDYCVRQTALDAIKHGYVTTILPSLVVSVGGDEATSRVFDEVIRACDS